MVFLWRPHQFYFVQFSNECSIRRQPSSYDLIVTVALILDFSFYNIFTLNAISTTAICIRQLPRYKDEQALSFSVETNWYSLLPVNQLSTVCSARHRLAAACEWIVFEDFKALDRCW